MKGYKRLTDRVTAEMLRNTEGESWDSDNIEAQCYIRLAELEDKIERGELIERTPEEYSAVRKQAVKEFAEKLRDKEFSVKIGSEWVAVVKSLDIDELVKEVCGE